VRLEARRYLELLIDCGADGFRFDAVKHMEPDYFAAVLAGLPRVSTAMASTSSSPVITR